MPPPPARNAAPANALQLQLPSGLVKLLASPMHHETGQPRPSSWAPPASLPAKPLLTQALGSVEVFLQPGGESAVVHEMAYMVAGGLAVRSTQDMSIAQERAYLTAQKAFYVELLAHLPADILHQATMTHARQSKWFPAPAELLEVAQSLLEERKAWSERLRRLIALQGAPKAIAAPRRPTTPAEIHAERIRRVRHSRDGWRRIGRLDNAASNERELAKLEGRDVEPWAAEHLSPIGAHTRTITEELVEIAKRPPTADQMRVRAAIEETARQRIGNDQPRDAHEPIGHEHLA